MDPFIADSFMSPLTVGSGLKGGEQKLRGLLRPKFWNTKVTFCQILSVKESSMASQTSSGRYCRLALLGVQGR